jgi:Spy/CpxP family protein refolding chaperone
MNPVMLRPTTGLTTNPEMSFMISFRALTTVSLLGLLVTLAGCSAESGTASGAGTQDTARASDTVAAQSSSDQAARGPARGPHPGGPDFLLVAALHEPAMNLSAEQKTTIEGALTASRPAAPPSFDKTRVSALAAGIRSGNVDTSSVKAPSPTQDGMAARQAAHAKALATLHATLTPEQRKSLVDAVAKRASEHGQHGTKDGARPQRGERAGGPPPGGPGAMGPMGPMGHMLEGLDLTKAQEETIRAKLEAQRPARPTEADREAMKKQHETFRTEMQAKLQTFANATFDANAFVAPPAGALVGGPGGPADHAARFAKDLSVIVSVLEPAQREKLAARIEAGPPAHGPKPMMPGAKIEQRINPQQ